MADWAPVVEEDLQRAPHGDPADDVQAFVDDLRAQPLADGQNELPDRNTDEQKDQPDHERHAPISKEEPQTPPGLIGLIREVVVNRLREIGMPPLHLIGG